MVSFPNNLWENKKNAKSSNVICAHAKTLQGWEETRMLYGNIGLWILDLLSVISTGSKLTTARFRLVQECKAKEVQFNAGATAY